jgi:type IV pilus assembly protein PilB
MSLKWKKTFCGEVKMPEKIKLGQILLEADLLSAAQLRQALAVQKKSKIKLGQLLVQEGTVRESQIVDLLARQLNIEKYRPDTFAIDLELAKMVPVEMAYTYQVAPIKKINSLLTIAMPDPLDINAVDVVVRHTKIEVETVICTDQQLNQLLNSLYGSFAGIVDILEGMSDITIDKADDKTTVTEDVEMSSLQNMAEEAPVVALANSILLQAIRDGASDVHISPAKAHARVRFRVDGKLHEMPAPPRPMFLPIVSRLKILAGMDIAVSRIPQDGRFTVKMKNKDINIRASTLPSIYGENVVLRLLDTSSGIYSLDRLGMPADDRRKIKTAAARPYGMILSTGPTGSGKSTSLYAILKQLNHPEVNIITVEDPVEYRIKDILQIQLNRKAGMTFAKGLRSILRQDPDVIMVGEIRDCETASIGVQAALTGHRVLSTIHTNDAASAVTRMIDMGIEPFLVSAVMAVSFAQRLVRKICPGCKDVYRPPKDVLNYWGLDGTDDSVFAKGKGCLNCMNTGYKGRTGLYEVLVVDEAIQELILNHNSAREIERAAIASGNFTPLKQNALDKVTKGITTFEEAASAVLV